MCGIAGFWSVKTTIPAEQGQAISGRMRAQLDHRGPDAEGHWQDAQQGIFLNHTRLSILDLSDAGAQPMPSHDGRYIMAYNGEIYNFKSLQKNLPKDFTPNGGSDSEILVESFAQLGIDKTLGLIKGMFAISLWDKQERTLHLIRDHMGKKPLYVGWVGDKLAFASELKALLALGEDLKINRKALEAYNYYGFIPAPYSIYEGISKLPPAHIMSISLEDMKDGAPDIVTRNSRAYWTLDHRQDAKETTLKDCLLRAVNERMIVDVPLGAFLSGGIDSSLITALMQSQSSRAVKTYSIGFTDHQFDESRHAEKIAEHLGTDHTTYTVDERECLSIIPDLPRIYDEPFADYSQIPTSVLCHRARKDTIVALSGDGGDEVFCGYKRYFMLQKLLKAAKFMPRSVVASAIKALGQDSYNRLGLNGKRMHSIAGFLSEKDEHGAILRTLSINPDAPRPVLDLGITDDLSGLKRMQMIDTKLYLPDDILVKVDRAAMAASLEVRSPLLDKNVVEYAWSLPLEDKIFAGQGRGKKPLYNLLCEYVPEELVNRPKQGFTPPIARWLRGELKDWAQELIHIDTGLYELEYTKKLWDDFTAERVDNHPAIWSILMAQSWALHNKPASFKNA